MINTWFSSPHELQQELAQPCDKVVTRTRPSPRPHRRRTKNNKPSPEANIPLISRLPGEILSLVFIWLMKIELNRTEELTFDYWSVTHPIPALVVLHVCASWRRNALACPHLWNRIEGANMMWTKNMLAHSRYADLAVKFAHLSPNSAPADSEVPVPPYFDLIFGKARNIKSLEFSWSDLPNEQAMINKLSSISFPALKAFHLGRYPAHPERNARWINKLLAQEKSKLECFSMRFPLPSFIWSGLKSPNLSILKIPINSSSLITLVEMLGNLPTLKTMDISVCLTADNLPVIPPGQPISLPNLTCFHFDFYYYGVLEMFLKRLHTPNLTTLDLSYHKPRHPYNFERHSTALQAALLSLQADPYDFQTPPNNIKDLTTARIFFDQYMGLIELWLFNKEISLAGETDPTVDSWHCSDSFQFPDLHLKFTDLRHASHDLGHVLPYLDFRHLTVLDIVRADGLTWHADQWIELFRETFAIHTLSLNLMGDIHDPLFWALNAPAETPVGCDDVSLDHCLCLPILPSLQRLILHKASRSAIVPQEASPNPSLTHILRKRRDNGYPLRVLECHDCYGLSLPIVEAYGKMVPYVWWDGKVQYASPIVPGSNISSAMDYVNILTAPLPDIPPWWDIDED